MKSRTGLLLRIAALFALVPTAHAYVDPGTGAMILQIIGAAVAGTLFFFHNLRDRVRGWFSRAPAARPAEPEDTGKDSDSPHG